MLHSPVVNPPSEASSPNPWAMGQAVKKQSPPPPPQWTRISPATASPPPFSSYEYPVSLFVQQDARGGPSPSSEEATGLGAGRQKVAIPTETSVGRSRLSSQQSPWSPARTLYVQHHFGFLGRNRGGQSSNLSQDCLPQRERDLFTDSSFEGQAPPKPPLPFNCCFQSLQRGPGMRPEVRIR